MGSSHSPAEPAHPPLHVGGIHGKLGEGGNPPNYGKSMIVCSFIILEVSDESKVFFLLCFLLLLVFFLLLSLLLFVA